MDTHSCKSVSIDLFNLPPLPDKQNKEESYMDMPIQLLAYLMGRIPDC